MRQAGVVAYRLGHVLGAGAFGITYLGWDVARNVRVAIKEYIPRDIVGRSGSDAAVRPHTTQHEAAFKAGLMRFVQEADALRQFRHPNIVNVVDFVNSNNTAYLVMPFHVGRTLGQYLDEQGKMEPAAAIRIILSILDGLRTVHEKTLDGRRWMHRDVKPDNILVRSDGIPLLIDFGAARTEIGEATRSMSRIFTAGYAPYEQIILGPEHQGPWIDVYATAATLYHAVTGQPPVDAPRRHLAVRVGEPDPLVRPRDLVADLPQAVDDAILTGMAIDYQDRPQDAGDMQQLLESAKQTLPGRKTMLLPEPRPGEIRTSLGTDKPAVPRKKMLIGAGLVAVAALALVSLLILRPGSEGGREVSPNPNNLPAIPPTAQTPADATQPTAENPLKPPVQGTEKPGPTIAKGPEGRGKGPLQPPEKGGVGDTETNPPPGPAPTTGNQPGPKRPVVDTANILATYKRGADNPGLRYRLVQRLESGRGVDVDPETTFHSGDNVRFVFESNIEGHLYIVQQGSSGNWSVLFPSPQINGGQHFIRPFEEYTVPSADRWFRFDEKPGDESIRVFLSKNPLDTFPGLAQAVVKQQIVEDAAVSRAVQGLKSRDLTLVQIPSDNAQPAGGTQPPGNYAISTDPATDAISILIKLIHR